MKVYYLGNLLFFFLVFESLVSFIIRRIRHSKYRDGNKALYDKFAIAERLYADVKLD